MPPHRSNHPVLLRSIKVSGVGIDDAKIAPYKVIP
eukprot:CAMPEP_0181107112 /NCGR_PEP_ID=MMETSP1071-20121207/16905_1 /TAXON_ID=35127 /ORGANISM="Thalassiosira sp., Strain NH16" /LENGTH=34 /DNA_ID= /DNA_START= /DNA_END= /DNA_ORIENTATION=